MNRLKLLAAVALLGIPLAACEETTPPPPIGSIGGQVSIEGTGIDGVSVNLSNGQTQTTSGGGNYRFDNVEGGAYTVTISGYPSDATFDATSQAATIASADQSVTLNFSGSFIRTASVMGTVTVENTGLSGVVVRLSGVSDASATTDASGRYSFTGLRMGNYSVEISGFDSDAVGFSSTASSTSVGVGESKIVSFDGTYLRTAGVSGQVSVEGEGLNGVMVSLRGGPDNVDESTTTDAAGQYAFASLRAGTYTVGISGWDDTDFEFEVTSKSVTVALGETGYVEFEGELLRTSGLAGRVSVGGMGMAGITVTLSGTADATANTDASGIYAFAGLAAGDYTVTISGYDAVEYSFDDSQDVTLEMDKTAIVNFDGMALRTASIKVMVTADGAGVAGVAATLTLVTSLNPPSGTIVGAGATDADGMHTFGPLLAGNYRVDISGADDEIDFADGMSWQGPVATDGMAEANFAGMINRTGSIAGMVTADGEGMGGVTVTLGGAGDASAMTADDGSYGFTGLRRGDYTVSVTNPNADMYSFPTTSRAVSVAIGQMHSDVSFAGTMIRRSSISGQVSVEGMGLGGVAVMLSGAHEATDSTDASGQYVFNGLGGGSYTVSFENPNGDAYDFDATSAEVMVGNAEAATQNFTGMHTRTASVSGMLFVDEVDSNDMYDEGEEMLAAADIELALIGPTIAMRQTANTDAEGNFTFENLRMGTYQLVVGAEGVPDDYGYGGPATGYELEVGAGMTTTQNIPFDITHQTVAFSVMLKSGDMTGDALPGATVTLYADMAGKDRVASGETDDDGMATIRFARADAGGDMVYAGVMAPEGDFDVAGDMQMVGWASKDKMTAASNSQDVVNLKAEVSFAGKTITTDLGGGMALAGWAIDVMMPGEGDEMVAVEGDDVPTMLDEMGMGSLTMMAESADDLPMTYYVQFDADQEGDLDGGEKYETVDKAMYTHTGLSLATEMDAGAATVRYTTQMLKVYVYEENDQIEGYTGNIQGSDTRMSGKVDVTIRHVSDTNRRATFDPKVWRDDRAYPGQTVWDVDGVVTFRGVPADHNVFVLADEVAGENVKILHPDNLDAFQNPDENGIMGGAFGPQGGFHHTVELCPLASDTNNQDGAECGSFAFVNTWEVEGRVSRMDVDKMDNGFSTPKEQSAPGTTFSLESVDGKNLADDGDDWAAAKTDNTRTPNIDETKQFDFGRLSAGVYKVNVPSGWTTSIGTREHLLESDHARDVDGDGADDEDPDDDNTEITVTPTTTTLYGFVTVAAGGDPEGVTVTVNGATSVTDEYGRYILKNVSRSPSFRLGSKRYSNHIKVEASKEGLEVAPAAVNHKPNEPTDHPIDLTESKTLATVSGVVTERDGTPIANAEIMANGKAPENKSGSPAKLVTGADGSYEAVVDVSADPDALIEIVVAKKDMNFHPGQGTLRVRAGGKADFTGYHNAVITGVVQGSSGAAIEGARVTVTSASDDDETDTNGFFRLSVPAGGYTIEASKATYSGFAVNVPERWRDGSGPATVYARDGDRVNNVRITAMTVKPGVVTPTRLLAGGDPKTYNGDVEVTWTTDVTDGVTFTVEADTDGDGGWDDLTARTVEPGATEFAATLSGAPDGAFKVRVRATTADQDPADGDGLSTDGDVSAIAPEVTDVEADRDENTATTINVSWTSTPTTPDTNFRVSVQAGGVWYITTTTATGDTRATELDLASGGTDWTNDRGNTVTVDADKLTGSLSIRVEATQGTPDEESEWKGTTDSVLAIPG